MLYHPPLIPMPDFPVLQHYGSFGTRRKFNVHSGVDLYAPVGENVYAVEDGEVVWCGWFTGSNCGTPWWNDTRALYVEGDTATIIYGEIQEIDSLQEGSLVKRGQVIGNVMEVLKKDKGKPTSMLHFSTKPRGYRKLYDSSIYVINLDPVPLLTQCRLNYLEMIAGPK